MITRIELTNFMSHAHTVIEPAAGLTVLVGPNNCGKSAVVAALQILCHNDNSTYVLRHGAKECSVKVTTSDDHTIEWRRKKSPSYVIDGQAFDRLRGASLPEELHRALRLPHVDDGGDSQFNVHFGEQKSPIFLLDRSPGTAAKFFSCSSDASRLLQMQRRHKEKLSQRQREKNRLEAQSRQLRSELETLQPAVDLDEQLKAAEQLHSLLVQEAAWIVLAERDQAILTGQLEAVARHEAQSQTLAPLKKPPELTPTDSLENLAANIERGEVELSRLQARLQALALLPTPPTLADDVALAKLIESMSKWAVATQRDESVQRTLLVLPQPPALADTQDLARLVERLVAAEQESGVTAARQSALAGILSPPVLNNEESLADLVARLAAAERLDARWAQVMRCSAIEPPATAGDWQPLAECVLQLEKATDQASRWTADLTSAAADLAIAETQLREFAATEACPMCGSPLDPDRLVAGAAGGHGGHDHG